MVVAECLPNQLRAVRPTALPLEDDHLELIEDEDILWIEVDACPDPVLRRDFVSLGL